MGGAIINDLRRYSFSVWLILTEPKIQFSTMGLVVVRTHGMSRYLTRPLAELVNWARPKE